MSRTVSLCIVHCIPILYNIEATTPKKPLKIHKTCWKLRGAKFSQTPKLFLVKWKCCFIRERHFKSSLSSTRFLSTPTAELSAECCTVTARQMLLNPSSTFRMSFEWVRSTDSILLELRAEMQCVKSGHRGWIHGPWHAVVFWTQDRGENSGQEFMKAFVFPSSDCASVNT